MRRTTVGLVAGWVVVGTALVGAGGAAGAAGHPTEVVARTAGTRSVGYGSLAITVPRSWAVAYGLGCPGADMVVIDPPSGVYYCPEFQSSGPTVSFRSVPIGTGGGPGATAIRVHGLAVFVQPGSLETTWALPKLGVEVTGVGPRGVAALHTLRPLR